MILIPDKTRIQSIDIRVRDLKDSLNFYSDLIGFKIVDQNDFEAILSSTGVLPYIIKLTEDKSAPVRIKGSTGLFHMAFLFPNRKELARVFMRLFKNNIKFQGFSDHLVSEAIYLSDPDGNGVELYTDKPRDQWQESHGQILMDTLLDDPEIWNGIHPDTTLGHLHLNVSELKKLKNFIMKFWDLELLTLNFQKLFFWEPAGITIISDQIHGCLTKEQKQMRIHWE